MIDFKELEDKQKKLIISIVLIIVFVLDFAFILKPQIQILGRVSKKASVLKRQFQEAQKDIAQKSDFENKLTLLKSKFKDFGSSIVLEEELPSILEEISRTANQTFVKITQIKPVKDEKKAILKGDSGLTYFQIPILIDAQSGYHSLGKFLNEIDNFPQIMKIVGLEITANPEDSARHLVRLTLETYVLGKDDQINPKGKGK